MFSSDQVNKLAVSEAERKDQEESKQDQPIVFGTVLYCRFFLYT